MTKKSNKQELNYKILTLGVIHDFLVSLSFVTRQDDNEIRTQLKSEIMPKPLYVRKFQQYEWASPPYRGGGSEVRVNIDDTSMDNS